MHTYGIKMELCNVLPVLPSVRMITNNEQTTLHGTVMCAAFTQGVYTP